MDYVLFDGDRQPVAEGSFEGVLSAATWAFEQGRMTNVADWELRTADGATIAWPSAGHNDGDYTLSDAGLAIWREQ